MGCPGNAFPHPADPHWPAQEEPTRSPEAAESLKLRAEIVHGILAELERRKLTQTRAAAIARISQPRMSDLMRGRVDLFSLDALVDLAAGLGLVAKVTLRRRRAA
jgi:predicted XRE-type DNA-binding protein